MKTARLITSSQRGVTLIELMVGVVVSAVVVAAGLAMLTMSEKAMRASEQTVDTQQNVRVAMEFLSRDLRQAGFGPFDPTAGAVGGCTSAIMPTDHNPLGADSGPDRISMVIPVGNPMGSAIDPPWVFDADAAINMGSATVIAMPSAAVVNTMATTAGGSLTGPQATLSIGGALTGRVTGVGGANLTLLFQGSQIESPIRKNTAVYLLQCITYQIIPPPDPTGLCGGRAPCLVRGVAGGVNAAGVLDCTTAGSACMSVADEIEDMQFAYACDGCVAAINSGAPDGIIDNQGGVAGFDQADFLTDVTWAATPMTPDKIRLAQVTVVGRQRSADQGFGEANRQTNQSIALQVSDHLHSAGVFAAGDYATLTPPYTTTRRRLLTKIVELRNLRQ